LIKRSEQNYDQHKTKLKVERMESGIKKVRAGLATIAQQENNLYQTGLPTIMTITRHDVKLIVTKIENIYKYIRKFRLSVLSHIFVYTTSGNIKALICLMSFSKRFDSTQLNIWSINLGSHILQHAGAPSFFILLSPSPLTDHKLLTGEFIIG